MKARSWGLGCVVAMSVACGGENGASEFGAGTDSGMVTGGPASTGAADVSGTSADSASSTPERGSTSTSDSTGADDVKFDMGMPDAPSPTEEGCEKIDFLFVIDNSGTMQS